MSAMHTPGPWNWDSSVWDYDPENDAPWLIDAEAKRVLWGGIKCDSEADAHLIAAAPDLLAVLREALDFPLITEGSDWWTRVRTATAKAEGKAS